MDMFTGYAYRKCETNGQWWNNSNKGTEEFAKSNYRPCVSQEPPDLEQVGQFQRSFYKVTRSPMQF